jgi:hypothetical protein
MIRCTECGRRIDDEMLSASSADVGAVTCADHEDVNDFGSDEGV